MFVKQKKLHIKKFHIVNQIHMFENSKICEIREKFYFMVLFHVIFSHLMIGFNVMINIYLFQNVIVLYVFSS